MYKGHQKTIPFPPSSPTPVLLSITWLVQSLPRYRSFQLQVTTSNSLSPASPHAGTVQSLLAVMEPDARIVAMYGPAPVGLNLLDNNSEGHLPYILLPAGLAGLTVVLRFCSRWVRRAAFEADDYFMAVALVGARSTPSSASLAWPGGIFRRYFVTTLTDIVSS